MNDFSKISSVWFIGIGGIGMSALASYFLEGGYLVGGYDRSGSDITKLLENKGVNIIYDDDPDLIPVEFTDPGSSLVIYTPAISSSNNILSWVRDKGFKIHKRAEILGMISRNTVTLAVAGTHGKTSVSTIAAHILKQSEFDCSAFLGGISKNYQTNLILGESNLVVMEADEYDRSFHQIKPEMALITSLDPDHLDIYGDLEGMIEGYNTFLEGMNEGGRLILNEKIKDKLRIPEGIKLYTYGFGEKNDFVASDISIEKGAYSFNVRTPSTTIKKMKLLIPGRMNIENTLAAVSLSVLAGVGDDEIRKAVLLYKGVKRRFDLRLDTRQLVYIDDYAHHPGELDYCIRSVREFYKDKKVTGVFQPHLYTRTRDHASAFAESLSMLDSVILLPVYPAREEAIPGVGSEMIYRQISIDDKHLMTKDELIHYVKNNEFEVFITMGAGDIDKLVSPVEEILRERTV